MRDNPFYGMSAAAMLFGCYMVSQALRLESGQMGKLLFLIGVLQVYECLLVTLGIFLTRTGRAPRDGVTVLLVESVFLMDAPLLVTESVTVDLTVGTSVALLLAALAAAKVAIAARLLRESLSRSAALILAAHALVILVTPVVAGQLAASRSFGPRALYGLWWVGLALPLARRALLSSIAGNRQPSRAMRVWSAIPAASVLLHLWSMGWIHQVGFHAAYAAPLLLGLAIGARADQVRRQLVLPAVALLLSLGQADALGLMWPVGSGTLVTPLRLAGVAGVATYWWLAWRSRHPWLVAAALATTLGSIPATAASGALKAVHHVVSWLASLVPRGTLAWGIITVAAAYALLALGFRRSLRRSAPGKLEVRARGNE